MIDSTFGQGGSLAASGPHRVGGVNRYIIDKRTPDRCKKFISCVESFVLEDSKTMLLWKQIKYDLVISRQPKGNTKSITTVDRDVLDVSLWPCDASWPSAWGEVVYRASGSVGLCEPDKFLYDCEGFRGTVWESAVDEFAHV